MRQSNQRKCAKEGCRTGRECFCSLGSGSRLLKSLDCFCGPFLDLDISRGCVSSPIGTHGGARVDIYFCPLSMSAQGMVCRSCGPSAIEERVESSECTQSVCKAFRTFESILRKRAFSL